MKHCPRCGVSYTDDTLNFCLDDGTALLSSPEAEETVIASVRNIPTQRLSMPPLTQFNGPEGKSGKFNFSYLAILILAILLAGSGVALFYERSKPTSLTNERLPEVPGTNSNATGPVPNATSIPKPDVSRNIGSRYELTSCSSIKDAKTGLEWYVGPDRNMTWNEAREWTISLNMCDGSWRMPVIEEIGTLYDPASKAGTGYFTGGRYFPAHIDPIFKAIGGGSWVWAAGRSDGDAQSFNLNQGKAVRYSEMNTVYSTRAFAVRNVKD